MIDIVIPLGVGSITNGHNNIEIGYSLKTIEKHLTGYRNIYIVGEHPGFDGNFIHVPCKDEGRCKEDNIRKKIMVACDHPDITKNFLFANDDYIYLKDINVNDIPYYYDYDLKTAYNRKRKIGHYKSAIENTIQALDANGKSKKHFDVHVPIIYNKIVFEKVMSDYDWRRSVSGFIIKSLYCNTVGIEGDQLNDMMIGFHVLTKEALHSMIEDRFVFAYNEEGINDVLMEVLEEVSQPKIMQST